MLKHDSGRTGMTAHNDRSRSIGADGIFGLYLYCHNDLLFNVMRTIW
jgi:hypothetical protein